MKISVVTKQPPGGSCTLYMHYADAIADSVNGRAEILYPLPVFPLPDEPLPPPPALLVDGQAVRPADGVLITAEEACTAVVAAGFTGDAAPLRRRLGRNRRVCWRPGARADAPGQNASTRSAAVVQASLAGRVFAAMIRFVSTKR